MKHMSFQHKDIIVRVHTPLVVTRFVEKGQTHELVYANFIDIDSRVQAVFAQFHHSRKASDVSFSISHAPRIGETGYDKSYWSIKPNGKYKHQSQRENETFVTGLVASECVLERQKDSFAIFAWDGNIQQKLFWAIEAYYETPLLEEWTSYLFNQLVRDKWLVPLVVHDFTGEYRDLVAYELLVGEDVLDGYISSGIRSGRILLTEDDEKEAI
ncbi:hypothetical protein GZH47_32190 (plasmid) [Paenibacillus rhizovicinus]|uniref:Uncharacterized protein n=1 Tax=Paenibacillus rhizovicinus TaxID=2704463 RepID=A0A6C0PAJ4_9BACL|nr:hypothetical protein [Paenibacillus rhizovicinus]QHW35548.1 hypothetical protein GZH47_32190 [Paenibacillus rhizovicinus]